MTEVMQSQLGAGASCLICFDPFGTLEDLAAPYPLACGHVFCMGCLKNEASCCPICGIAYDRSLYVRLLNLRSNPSLDPTRLYDDNMMGAKLLQDFARVTHMTSIAHLQTLHGQACCFLDTQPRSLFNDLEANVRLVQCILEAKYTLQSQAAVINTLVDQIGQLRSEKIELAERLEEVQTQHDSEVHHIMSNIPQLVRGGDTEFELFTDEVVRFRTEMNGTRGSFEELKVLIHEQLEQLEMQGYGSAAVESDDYPRPIPPQPITPPATYRSTHPPMQPTSFAPSIQVYPPSQSSTSNYSMQGSWTGSLSTLAMSVIADGFGAVRVRPQVSFSEINDFNSVAGTPSSSSSRNPGDYNVRAADAVAGMDREAMFAQTRRFSRVVDGSAPDPRSSSEANIRAEAAADAQFSPTEVIVTPYYSPLSGSRSPSPNPSSDEDVTSLDIPPTELEYTDPTTTTDDEPHKPHSNIPTDLLVDSESVTSASFSITTMPTPFLPLLRTPPNLRFHLDLNERLDHLLSSHPTDAPAQSFTPAQTLMMMIVEAIGSAAPPTHPTRVPRRQGSLAIIALAELMDGSTEQSHYAGIDRAHPMGGVVQLRTGSYSGGARRYNGTLLADVKASLVEVLERVLMHLRANTTASVRAPITQAAVLLESSQHSMVTQSVDSHVVEASAVDSNPSRSGMCTEPADSQQVQRSSNQTRSSSGTDSDPGEYVGTNDHSLVAFERRDVEILPITPTRQV